MRDIFFILLLVLSVATAPVRGEVKEEKPLASTGTTYYVRTDGGSGSQCTGKTDAPYPGTGTNQPCAWSHPFRALDGSGNWKLQGGDTLIIASGSYMMGYGAPNTSGWCDQSYTYGCTLPPLPSGPDANHPTRILGKGWDSNCVNPPELWGTQRPWQIINLGGSSNVYIGCLEITDHSGCVEFHSNPSARCERDTWPYGDWASQGIVAWDASNVTLKHLNIHGLASNGIRAGRISDWTVEDVRIAGNGWAGWDGDLADENDSNSGTLTFDRLTIEWNGCGETYPGKQPHYCWGQTAGGYGDGLGTGATGGHWIFRDSVFRYNTSDGLDLLYARNPGSKIDIKRTQSYGNAGNPIKVNGDAAIENSLLVGNCGFFSGKSFTYNVDHCRALGNSLELSLRKGVTGSVINSTIVGQGDCLVSVGCDDSSCDGTETIILQNNIFMGYDEFLNSWDTTCYIYLDQNNLYTTQIDYNIVYNTKISSVGLFSHDIDQDPLFVNNSLSSFDGHLQSAGPAIDSGLSVGSLNGLVPSGDIEGNTRPAGSGVDRGAYEYGSGGGGSQAQIAMTRTRLYYGASGGSISDAQTVAISNSGSGTLNWTAASGSSWLGISPGSGTDSGIITVSVNASGLSAGTYTGSITVSSANASNSPQTIAVTLEVYGAGQGSSPIGAFDTPLEGTTARSSIPVTGWALDDIRVSSVKIFRGTSESPVYIGDAVFIEGARPDVERAYPGYPSNYKAGWGYMLLTNFLPNSGNGTFTLRAIAEDVEGNSVTLGTRTITCDNANAVKPFGAIDTPTQGGTASGGGFINWGWVLTPRPNTIPTDGSTIDVWVDGVNLGHPVYNIFREDIASLFPSYANSGGAVGYFQLDTTAYEDGVHTIQWTAVDNVGNTDGIGSRYFTIQNGESRGARNSTNNFDCTDAGGVPMEYSAPVGIRTGYDRTVEPFPIYPDVNGIIDIRIKELEPLEIHFSAGTGNRTPLPVGSTLDTEKGIFYWQPGPGFIGRYPFTFIKRENSGEMTRVHLLITIMPKF